MLLKRYILTILLYGLKGNEACHSLSSQNGPSWRARARGVPSLTRTSENAINFDYLTSNLPYSANEIRSKSSLTPLPDKPLLTVSDGGKLTCHFDDEMEYCGWHNSENTEMKFWKAKLDSGRDFDSQRFEAGSPLSFSTYNNFLLAGGEPMEKPQKAAIEMEIPCQYGDADVKFDFWTNTLNIMVLYCMAKADEEFNNCHILQRVSNPLNFSIPTTVDGLRIRIEVSNIDSDSIALIDNLHYNGQICELVDETVEQSGPSFSVASSSSSTIPSLITGDPVPTDPTVQKFFEEDGNSFEETKSFSAFGIQNISSTFSPTDGLSQVTVKELSPCSALTCNFNDGDSCFYGLSGAGSTGTWTLSDRLVGNRHTGIQRVNINDQSKVGFVYVGSDIRSDIEYVFVVESPKFSLQQDASLIFDIYIRSVNPRLKVCIDNFDNCPYNSPSILNNKFWRSQQKVVLKKGTRKVFFVAENVKKHQYLAIDNITLENADGSSSC